MKCPLCGSEKIIFDSERGEYYCSVCGYVLEIEQVVYIERQGIRHKEKKSKMEILTEKRAKEVLDRKRERTCLKYNREEQKFWEIQRIFARFNVSEVDKAEARRLLRKSLNDDELRKYISYCTVLIAKYILNSKGIMVTLEQVAEMSNVPKSRYRILRRVWRKMYAKGIFKKRVTVAEYLYYAFNRLNIPLEFMDEVYEIWTKIDGYYNGYSSRVSPKVFAGVLIQLLNDIYGLGIKSIQIAEVLGITTLIIRIHYKKLKGVIGGVELDNNDENNV